jgi:predicted O-methyltransferase YrrM
LHSPFVFELFNKVIKAATTELSPRSRELRRQLLRNDQSIDVTDFKTKKSRRATIASIAKSSLSSPKFMNMLRRLTDHIHASVVLETGTSLGLSVLHLAESTSADKIVSIEGSEILYRIAQRNCAVDPKVEIIHGDLYDQLGPSLIRYQPDIVFLDADHRSTAIQFCLDQIMMHCPAVKCIVIHDIYWSIDMATGWKNVIENGHYPLTIDLFEAGLIFPNHPIVKQHFTLRF